MRKRIIIMIISVIFFFGMIDLFVVMTKEYKMTEENTVLLTATVESVNINDTGDNIYLLININEYEPDLMITSNVAKRIDLSLIEDLENGEKISFRIEKSYEKYMSEPVNASDSVAFVPITSLSAETKDIFSLENYNATVKESGLPSRIICIVMAAVFLTVFIYFCFSKPRKNIRAKKTPAEEISKE